MSTPDQEVVTRPVSVTVASVLVWISAGVSMASGLILILFAGNTDLQEATEQSVGTLRWLGFLTAGVGVILAIVAAGISRGSSVARLIVTVVEVVNIGAAVWALVTLGWHSVTEGLVAIFVALVALALLWNARANAFFAES